MDSASLPNTQDERTFSQEEIDDADFRAVANTTALIVFPEYSSRGKVVEYLTRYLPINEYGLPTHYIRSDLLPWPSIQASGTLLQDDMDAASEPLGYADGYPTFTAGSPFWTQMPHEDHASYILLQRFIELAEMEGIRLHSSLALQENVPLERIRNCALEYFWSSRSRAYDLFIVAAEAKRREVRTRKAENTHFVAAGKILEVVINKINDDPELIRKMDGKELFDLFEQMIKIQRLSLGLVGAQSSTNTAMPQTPGQGVEMILRSITKNAGATSESSQLLENRMALLLSDPKTAMMAQELIIRTTAPGNFTGGR